MSTTAISSAPGARQIMPGVGLYPWIAIFLGGAFLIYKYVLFVFPSIMMEELMHEYDVGALGLGNISAVFYYFYSITQLFVGALLDRFGVRRLSSLALGVSALGALLFWYSESLTVAIVGRALMGIGAAFATVSYMKIAAMWFRKEQFAFVGGMCGTAAMVGAIAGQRPLLYVVELSSWRESILYVGLLGVLIAAAFYLVIRDREEVVETPTERKFSWSDIKTVVCNKQNLIVALYSGLAFGPITGYGGLYGPSYVMAAYEGISKAAAASAVSCVFWGMAFGAPLLSVYSNHVGSRIKVAFWGNTSALIFLCIAIYVPNMPYVLLCLFHFLFGFATGAFLLSFAIGRETNPLAVAATVVALINTGDAIFEAATEPLIGAIMSNWGQYGADHHYTVGEYHTAFLVMPAYLVVASLLIFLIKEPPKDS